MAYVPPLNGGRINATISGNTAGVGALVSTGTLVLAGGNNITLSQSTNVTGATISINGTSGGGVALYDGAHSISSGTASIAALGGLGATITNQTLSLSAPQSSSVVGGGIVTITTSGASVTISAPAFSAGISSNSTVSNQLILAAGNNVTLSQSTNATGATVSVGASGVLTTQSYNSAEFAGSTANSTMPLLWAGNSNGSGNITLGLTGSTVTGSAPSGGGGGIAMSASNSSWSTGTVDLVAAGGALTINYSTTTGSLQSINVSVPATSSLSASGIVSISTNGSTISVGAPAFSAGVSNLSNDSGNTGMMTNRLVLAGGNNITLSQSTNANGATVSVIGGAGGGGGVAVAGAGTTYTSGTANFVTAGGAITIGSSTNGGSQTLNFSVPATSSVVGSGIVTISTNGASATISAPAFSAGISSNSTVSNQLILTAGNNITLSQSTNATGATVSIIGGALGNGIALAASNTTWANSTVVVSATGGLNLSTNGSTVSLGLPMMSQWMHNSAAVYSSSTGNMINGTMSIVRMLIPDQLSFSRVDFPVSVSGSTSATANTAAMAITAFGVIYSRSGSTLNPIVGQSSATTYSYASSTGVYSSITGPRVMSFNLATSLNPGEYYFGLQLSSNTSSVGTATTNLGWTVAPIYGTSYSAVPWIDMSSATAQTINIIQPLQGINSATITATNQTLQQSQITQSGGTSGGLRGNLIVILRNN